MTQLRLIKQLLMALGSHDVEITLQLPWNKDHHRQIWPVGLLRNTN